MREGARIAASIELLESIYAGWAESKRAPADLIISDYFKARRYMGSKDRGFVSHSVYFTLRYGGSLQWWLEQNYRNPEITPRQVLLLGLVMDQGYTAEELDQLCTGKDHTAEPLSRQEYQALLDCENQDLIQDSMPEWARYNVTDWLIPKLRAEFGEETDAAIAALNEEAPVDLRVNTLKGDRSDLIMALDRAGYYGTPTPLSELGVRMPKRLPVYTLDAYKNGLFDIQEEGSQILAALVEAQPGQKVIDFCAGAGGKTLAIAAAMKNKGTVMAWDVNEKRLSQIRKRLDRAGVHNVAVALLRDENDPLITRNRESADWVLVDAPCSGSGTWRRNPDLKWRFQRSDLEDLKALQASILANASKLVKPGGTLVYATCSLLAEENQQQVSTFLADHPDYKLADLPKHLEDHRLWQDGLGACLRLLPHKTHTDGFFAAILKRL